MTATTMALPATTQPSTTAPLSGMTTGAVRTWLRLEGLAAFWASAWPCSAPVAGNWLLLIPLLLLPDVSAVGFLAGPRIGTFTYNLVHNWVPGIVTLGIGVWLASPSDHRRGSHPHRPRRDGSSRRLRAQAAELVPRHASRPNGANKGVSPARARTSYDDIVAAGRDILEYRRPRRGHDACRRRTRRRSSSVPVQAVRRSGGTHRGDRSRGTEGPGRRARAPRPGSGSQGRSSRDRERPFARSRSATPARTSSSS